ncbi:hypothetical protein [Clostridium sp. FP1]|uniref:hypothetical protein n=1 Tax=Clostridium sp. FP1 TaxID=2724076 RepID=UPI0013E94D32|nr:hypothetical protein [Clostridium sp. FP1]MBZ9633083.1 hypothetical protein [Clostridium sp. FP1]
MAIFGNMSITNAGQILYAKAQAGKPIVFTKMSVGSGLVGTRNPATLTTLVQTQFDVAISSIIPDTLAQSAAISGTINNTNMVAAIYICELGLWATDPDVGLILYGYASAGTFGDYMAPATQGAYAWLYQINAAIGNAANVTANISSLMYDYSVLVTDKSLSVINGGNQKAINKSVDNVLASNATILSSHSTDKLLRLDIKGSIQIPTISSGKVTQILHKINGVTVRTDNFTYATNLVTEIRTLNTSETLTLKYHTDTMQTEVI